MAYELKQSHKNMHCSISARSIWKDKVEIQDNNKRRKIPIFKEGEQQKPNH